MAFRASFCYLSLLLAWQDAPLQRTTWYLASIPVEFPAEYMEVSSPYLERLFSSILLAQPATNPPPRLSSLKPSQPIRTARST